MKTATVDWNRYQLIIENVAPEDGGGFRIFYPTLGYAAYGVGDTLQEAFDSLECAKTALVPFIEENGITLPPPSREDLLATSAIDEDPRVAANNNYAYAA